MIEWIEDEFPGLRRSSYRVTSPPDERYNCIAWAAGEDSHWWWPDRRNQDHWPDGIPRKRTLEAFAQAYATRGYERCEARAVEPGFIKVAIFVNTKGQPTHAARQLPTGRWTSKLGNAQDIEHELTALEGDRYGTVAMILKRPTEDKATD